MKILFLDWNSYCNEDAIEAFSRCTGRDGEAVDIIRYPFENTAKRTDPTFEKKFASDLKTYAPWAVFSFDYYPIVSLVCNRENINYIAFVYDNPQSALYSYTLINKCNHVFIFDSQVAETFQQNRIPTIQYMPLAVSTQRMDAMIPDAVAHEYFDSDVAFVGSLYTEEHTFYDEMEPLLDDYTRGYLQGLIAAQLEVDGISLIEDSLTPQILHRMAEVYPIPLHDDGVETSAWLYANYVLYRKITSQERLRHLTEIGRRLGNRYSIALYTRDKMFSASGIDSRGDVDYYKEMPYVFKCAKINLNFTLRSIYRGIPLRAFDIMGAGGFLLTNYQADLCELFVPGEDFVYYNSNEDLINKIHWYLMHDEERRRIASNGHDKVRRLHTWDIRMQQILNIVQQSAVPPRI